MHEAGALLHGWLAGVPVTIPRVEGRRQCPTISSCSPISSNGMEDVHRSCIMIKREFNSQNPAVAPSFV
jgi:hypothetical protein